MDIRDEVKASKGDELPKSSLLPDSDQNNQLNKPQLSSGAGVTMSERDMLVSSNPQSVSQFNPIIGELIMSSANSKSMFDGTLASFDAKWESFSNQVSAQFKGNKGGLALGGIDLKKLFARHLKQYGHIRHTQVAKVKHTVPKLKWKTKENFHDCGIFTMLHMKTFDENFLSGVEKCKTKENFHDCGIFTMLHMETFDGGHASNLDCGLPVESRLWRDMLRRLRFKFATKIFLHEINVHAGKMLELTKEFDKTYPVEKMAIIVDAFKKKGGT
nr:hypothetical protein [Tanacetum cinerariifolium]